MLIVIPMAGQSSRFRKAGYRDQKFRLPLGDETVLDRAVGSFSRYFPEAEFLFITRNEEDAQFARERAAIRGIKNAQTYVHADPRGFHETVYSGLRNSGAYLDQPVILHVVDTFRPDFQLPEDVGPGGYVEFCQQNSRILQGLYRLAGESLTEPPRGQSKVVANRNGAALLRGTGLYYFPSGKKLLEMHQASERKREKSRFLSLFLSQDKLGGYFFFKELLRRERGTQFRLINRRDAVFCGVPREYQALGGAKPPANG